MPHQIQATFRPLAALLTACIALPGQAVAWNITGHMLNGVTPLQILRQESLQTFDQPKVFVPVTMSVPVVQAA